MNAQKIICIAVQEDHYSRDVEVYMPFEIPGEEFKFRVWLDKEDDTIETGEAEYAEDETDSFDAYDKDPPAVITLCLTAAKDAIETFLRNPKEKWVGSKMELDLLVDGSKITFSEAIITEEKNHEQP